MSKTKTSSKNNAALREKAQEYLYNGKKIKPVKLVSQNATFIAAEFEDGGDIVMGAGNRPLPWAQAISTQ